MSAEDECWRFNDAGPDRSSGQYTSFTDLYEQQTTVQHSSLAELDAVWIFTDLLPQQKRMLRDAGLNPAEFTGSAHLCRAMAAEIRDALDKFLTETAADDNECGPG